VQTIPGPLELNLPPSSTAYVSPSSDNSKAKTVIFIADIFGYELVNTRLVADEYAAQGFHVLVPDFFEGTNFAVAVYYVFVFADS
jgi:dienelactone hydrolase